MLVGPEGLAEPGAPPASFPAEDPGRPEWGPEATRPVGGRVGALSRHLLSEALTSPCPCAGTQGSASCWEEAQGMGSPGALSIAGTGPPGRGAHASPAGRSARGGHRLPGAGGALRTHPQSQPPVTSDQAKHTGHGFAPLFSKDPGPGAGLNPGSTLAGAQCGEPGKVGFLGKVTS